jgi:hypothetical protein
VRINHTTTKALTPSGTADAVMRTEDRHLSVSLGKVDRPTNPAKRSTLAVAVAIVSISSKKRQ